MNNSSLSRIGGIAALLGIVLSLGSMAMPALLAIGSLAVAVFIFALYRLFSPLAATVSLVTAIVGIVGAIVLAIMSLSAVAPNNSLSNLATWASWMLPPLAFGFLAYQHPEAGFSRLLGIIGILGGVAGLLNLIVVLIGGGNWAEPNNPALGPVIMVTYYVAMLLTLVWLVWTGVVLLRSKPTSQRQPA